MPTIQTDERSQYLSNGERPQDNKNVSGALDLMKQQ